MEVQVQSPPRQHAAHAHAHVSPSRPVGGKADTNTNTTATTLQRSRSPVRHQQHERGRSRSPAKVARTPSTTSSASVLSATNVHNEQRDRHQHQQQHPIKTKRRSLSPLKRTKSNRRKSFVAQQQQQQQQQPVMSAQLSAHAIEDEFERMLVHREIPSELCEKLQHLDIRIKENFVRNQAVFNISSLGALANGSTSALPPRDRKQSERSRASSPVRALLGKSSSTVSLTHDENDSSALTAPDRKRLFSQHNRSSSSNHSASASSSEHLTGSPHLGYEAPRGPSSQNRSPSPRRPPMASSSSHPAYYAKHLLNTPSRRLDIDRLKKLRVRMSTESPAWLGDFLFTERGYEGLLKRIGELVEMEWREEIHDDRALHELLRSMSYLGDTDKGMLALSSLLFRPYTSQLHHIPQLPSSGSNQKLPTAAPAASTAKEENPPELAMGWECHPPFGPLVGMLLSERKPGDLATRKLLIDVLALLPKMRLPPGLSHSVLKNLKAARETSSAYALFEELAPLSSHHMLFLLLHNPLQARSLSLLPFIQQSHHPRPFKTYLREVEGVVRDYFWIFCHSRNRFWDWEMFGEEGRQKIEGPTVPGGMTGGVEFEAMAYVTANFKLINNLASSLAQISSPTHPISQHFHAALFDSGLERILSTLRRSSQQYYAQLHLAMARYVLLCRQSGYRLPRGIDEWCDRPSRPSWERLEVSGLSANGKAVNDEWKWEDVRSGEQKQQQQQRGLQQAEPQPHAPPRSSARPKSPAKAAPTTATTAVSPSASPSKSNGISATSSSSSLFGGGTGKWLGKGQSAAAFLATTSASDRDFFDEPVGGVQTASAVPLPASPVKGDGMAAYIESRSPTKGTRSPWETVGNPIMTRSVKSSRSRPGSPQKASAGAAASATSSASPSKTTVQRGFEVCEDGRAGVGASAGAGTTPTTANVAPTKSMGRAHHAASHVVKVGTAKDRIKLWEGRMVRD